LINFSGEIEKDIVWRHSEFTLYRGHIINKSNEVVTVIVRRNIDYKIVYQKDIFPGTSVSPMLEARGHTFTFKSHPYGRKVGERLLTINSNKVFHSKGYSYWFVEYLGKWSVKAGGY